MQHWRRIKSHYPIDNRWVKLRQDVCELPDGRMIDDYFVLEENDVGSVFALTPDQKLVMVEQYKHGVGKLVLELPAGFFEAQTGDPVAESRREFIEETGYDAAEYHYLGKLSQSPTRMTNYIYLYLALDAFPTGTQHLDENEAITVRLLPMDEVFAKIASGEINAVATVAGIYMGWQAVQARSGG
ncbi:MAG: NUDIX hydrolase [Anaerolineae bacterium]|nr:NUDIX hydrolase [Anaerolineae bacterium]